MKKVNYCGSSCNVMVEKYYTTDNTCLRLYDEDGLVAVATVNLDASLPSNQAYIKDYSENEGMVEALTEAGILGKKLNTVPIGYVQVSLYELNLGD